MIATCHTWTKGQFRSVFEDKKTDTVKHQYLFQFIEKFANYPRENHRKRQ